MSEQTQPAAPAPARVPNGGTVGRTAEPQQQAAPVQQQVRARHVGDGIVEVSGLEGAEQPLRLKVPTEPETGQVGDATVAALLASVLKRWERPEDRAEMLARNEPAGGSGQGGQPTA